MSKGKKELMVAPLGGCGELGKNMLVVRYGGEIVVLDAGSMIPEEEMLGVDTVIPDISYLKEHRQRVRGIVLSHGHEDHVGALPHLLRELPVTVYGTPLTMGLLARKLEGQGVGNLGRFFHVVPTGQKVRLGTFTVEFVHVNHSIPDAAALVVHTPVGVVAYTGDFKFDQTPVDGRYTDMRRLSELGERGVLLLLSESTRAEYPGYTPSEAQVDQRLEPIFLQAAGRVLLSTVATNLHRVQQVLQHAARQGRKVTLVGQSLVEAVQVAQDLGFLEYPRGLLVSWEELASLPPRQQVVLASGSQGNPLAMLAPQAMGGERDFRLMDGDTVIILAGEPLANRRTTAHIIDELFLEGARVYHALENGVSPSGHASQEELKMMINLLQPQYFMPVHGEYRQLVHHARIARAVGIPEDNIIVLENGSSLTLGAKGPRLSGKIEAGQVLVDGLGVGDVGKVVLRDRQQLSQDGILIAVITMDRDRGEVVAGPDIISRGFVYMRESEELMAEARDHVREVLERCQKKRIDEWSAIKRQVRESLARFLYEKTRRRPMILPIIMEI